MVNDFLRRYGKTICTGVFAAVALCACIAIFSFDLRDRSLFFYSSNADAVHNWMGSFGAHGAALLFYLIGSAAYLVALYLAYGVYCMITGKQFAREWDRLGAGALLVVIVATMAARTRTAVFGKVQQGGIVGNYVHQHLMQMCDFPVEALLLFSLFLSCIVLITRLNCIAVGRYGAAFLAIAFNKQKCIDPVYVQCTRCIAFVRRPLQYLWNLLTGASIAQSGGTVAQLDLNEIAQEVFAHNGDPFWDNYLQTKQAHQVPTVTADVVAQPAQKKETVLHVPVAPKIVNAVYELPHLTLFKQPPVERNDNLAQKECKEMARVLEEKLERFGIVGSVISIKRGPVITLFEYEPDIDCKISKIIALEDDLALALQAMSIRIIAPIPGRSVVGFEVSNKDRKSVLISSIIHAPEYKNFSGYLPLILGKDVQAHNVLVDLAKAPHLLVAGSTGSGKSVALNTMLISLLCKCSPKELKLILIDPKRLEFASYADIPHLLFPIVVDPKKAGSVLKWVVKTMEDRYTYMASKNVRNIFDYNTLCQQEQDSEPMDFIVVVIDELADLMMTTGKEIEDLIARIAQMARAAGIHMIIATQRPSVDVITGLIKVNFTTRISFKVTSKIDSRTILDCGGAEKLLGKGDMLYLDSAAHLLRVHGAYVTDKEIDAVVSHVRAQQAVEYIDLNNEFETIDEAYADEDSALMQEVLLFLQTVDSVSISLLQRKFRIGYNRSARIIERLEMQGRIMPSDGGKTRKVIHT